MARHDADDAFDERGVLKDGRSIRVHMMMMDGGDDGLTDLQRSVRDAATPVRLVDAFGDSGAGLCRPGSRHLAVARGSAEHPRLAALAYNRVAAYADSVQEMTDAWKVPATPPAEPLSAITGYGSRRVARSQKAGDLCTINGFPGHLNEKLECIPDRRQDAQAINPRDAAYAEMCEELANAWRCP